MRLTNKYRTLIKRAAELAEAHADVKTADGHMVRKFFNGTTSRKDEQIKKTSSSQLLQKTRNVTTEAVTADAVSKDLNGLVEYLKDVTLSRHIDSRFS